MSGGVGTEKEWAPGGGRNKRTVWTIATQPFPEAHFATFPEDLVRPCIQAGTSAVGCCPSCHSPWERSVEKHFIETGPVRNKINEQSGDSGWEGVARGGLIVKTRGWKPTCACEAGDPIPCSVLDPFSGSGTTGLVALKHGRTYIGIELNPEYADLSREYLDAVVTGVSVKEKRSGQQALFNQSTIFEKASTA